MRMRALPQSFWQQPNVADSMPPSSTYPILPPLYSKDSGEDVTGEGICGSTVINNDRFMIKAQIDYLLSWNLSVDVCFMHDVFMVVVAKWTLRHTVVCYVGDVIVLWLPGNGLWSGTGNGGFVLKLVDLKFNGRCD